MHMFIFFARYTVKACTALITKRVKYKSLCMRVDTTNVEHEMYDWCHRNSNTSFKEKFGSHTSNTFNRFITKDSYTWNITYNADSTAV